MFPLSYTNIISGSSLSIQNIQFILTLTEMSTLLFYKHYENVTFECCLKQVTFDEISEKKKPFMKNVLHYNIFVLLF